MVKGLHLMGWYTDTGTIIKQSISRIYLHVPTVHEADKSFIRNMLTKPWNLYIFRHSALTEKSQILPESVLKDHAGWTMSSRMASI